MKVSLLYFDGCPNWRETDALLRQALRVMGRGDVEVGYVLVSTPEAADATRFRGSPTVLVDGRDPFANPAAPVGLSCRLYRTEAGVADSPMRHKTPPAGRGEAIDSNSADRSRPGVGRRN